jgi:hypothetical protein
MKPIVCVYCEGTDTKFGVFVKEKQQIKMLKAASIDQYHSGDKSQGASALDIVGGEAGLQIDGGAEGMVSQAAAPTVFEAVVNSELTGIKLHQAEFIPILTEPSIYYHHVARKTTSGTSKEPSLTQELITEDGDLKEKKIDRETHGYVELADGAGLTVYVRQDISCVRMINKLAQYNNRRIYKIVSIKSAEVSLVNYVAKKKKFFPDDFSLIVYIGKEYSKLIFLQGRKLKHIGVTLDIGTTNLHTYDVYFSKILLEMENGGIPTLDNITVCGEDVSENLILSFYGTFPETNVSRVEFEEIDVSGLNDDDKAHISSFTLPIAVATEYYEEMAKEFTGLNLIPRYIKEDQKFFQFAWHGYMIVPLLFAAAFYITFQVLKNNDQIDKLNKDIIIQTELKNRNLEILGQINQLTTRIDAFDQTQKILDSITVGTEVWGNFLQKVGNFSAVKRNFWLRNLAIEEGTGPKVEGHSLSRNVLTELTSALDSALLKSITYDPIRGTDAYRFLLHFKKGKK